MVNVTDMDTDMESGKKNGFGDKMKVLPSLRIKF